MRLAIYVLYIKDTARYSYFNSCFLQIEAVEISKISDHIPIQFHKFINLDCFKKNNKKNNEVLKKKIPQIGSKQHTPLTP